MALTYSITGGADAAKFNINATSGALTFKTAPDFEHPGDADTNNIYVVEVGVSDGTAITKQVINVTVTNVADENLPPQFTSPAAYTVPENQTTVATLTATDPDAGTPPIEPPVEPPVTGDYPNASNTGIPAGVTLTNVSAIQSSAAGQVIEAKNVGGMIHITHPNVKIKNCKVQHIIAHEGADRSGLVVENCEIVGSPAWNSAISVVGATNFILRKCNIHGTERGIWMQSNQALLEENYFHDLINNTGTHDPHIDGIQVPNAENAVIRHNNVDCAKNVSASMTMNNVKNLRAERNRLNGGSYTMYVEGSSTGCMFDRNDFTDCYYGWIAGVACGAQTYTQNTFGGGAPMNGYPPGANPSSGGKAATKPDGDAPDPKKDRGKDYWTLPQELKKK